MSINWSAEIPQPWAEIIKLSLVTFVVSLILVVASVWIPVEVNSDEEARHVLRGYPFGFLVQDMSQMVDSIGYQEGTTLEPGEGRPDNSSIYPLSIPFLTDLTYWPILVNWWPFLASMLVTWTALLFIFSRKNFKLNF